MSESKFSIGHFLGLGISVCSLIAGLVTQCQPRDRPNGALGGQESMPKASGPVIDPNYVFVFEEMLWWDSLPFRMEVLADAGVRFVDVEQLSLPIEEVYKPESMDLGPSVGEHRQLATYTIDPAKRRLKSFMCKDFRYAVGGAGPLSVNARFEDTGMSGYPTVYLTEIEGSKTIQDHGEWFFGAGSGPSMLKFDHRYSQYYLQSPEMTAALAYRTCWYLKIYLADKKLKMTQMLQACKGIQSQILAKAGLEPATKVRCACIQGNPKHMNNSVLGDLKAGTGESSVFEYDSLGQIKGFQSKGIAANDWSRWLRCEYDEAGRIAAVSDSTRELKKVYQFSYLATGWPEKVVAYDKLPDGKVRVMWRTFFKFKRA